MEAGDHSDVLVCASEYIADRLYFVTLKVYKDNYTHIDDYPHIYHHPHIDYYPHIDLYPHYNYYNCHPQDGRAAKVDAQHALLLHRRRARLRELLRRLRAAQPLHALPLLHQAPAQAKGGIRTLPLMLGLEVLR